MAFVFNKTLEGKITQSARKVLDDLDGYIDGYHKAKGEAPPRLLISKDAWTRLVHEDAKEASYRGYKIEVENG